MNAGLSNLATLKAWLLAPSLLASTEYDDQIAAIGLGVAAQLEKFCARQFARTVGDVFECTADREHVTLPRYPVEAVATVEQSDADAAWSELSDAIQQRALDRGMLYFGTQLGTYLSRIRITYTGGYFWEQAEPSDEENYPTEVPEGSTALPADLLLAWKLQCEHVWAQRDKLGLNLGQEPSQSSSIASIVPLLEVVKEQLRPHQRFAGY